MKLAAAVVLALVPAVAAAEPDSYRAQLLVADGAVVALVAADPALGLDGAGVGYGVVLGLTAAPIIHAVHGEWGRVGGSIGLRYGLGAAGWLLGAQLAGHGDGTRSATMGLLLGTFTGAVIDDLFQSSSREPRQWAPTIAPGVGGAQLGVVGVF
jgi:hypothetical protein